jgi:hypothetical protein
MRTLNFLTYKVVPAKQMNHQMMNKNPKSIIQGMSPTGGPDWTYILKWILKKLGRRVSTRFVVQDAVQWRTLVKSVTDIQLPKTERKL